MITRICRRSVNCSLITPATAQFAVRTAIKVAGGLTVGGTVMYEQRGKSYVTSHDTVTLTNVRLGHGLR